MSPSTPIRLVALDLDGIPARFPRARSPPAPGRPSPMPSSAGVIVLPCTGRPLASLPPLVAQLPGIRYAITTNGAAVWDMGTDPLGAVYSRYADAARRQTHQPVRLLHRPMPPGDCPGSLCALSGVPRPAEHLFGRVRLSGRAGYGAVSGPGKNGIFPPRPGSRTMAAITLCVTSPSG